MRSDPIMASRKLRSRLLLVSVLAVLLLPPAAAAQEPPPGADPEVDPSLSFAGQVEQVVVDVVVTDGDGNPILGLGPGDLEVYEEGKRQEIVTFDAFEVAPQPSAPEGEPAVVEPPRVSTNAVEEKERHGRTFVIVFDDLHFTPRSAIHAREAVKKFIREETHEGDRVMLLSTGGSVWWSGRMLSGREQLIGIADNLRGGRPPDTSPDHITDYEAMMIHVDRDVAIMNRVQRRFETYGIVTGTFQGRHIRSLSPLEDPVITTRAAEVYFGSVTRNRATLDSIVRALEALVPVEGRKSVILVSDGFIYDRVLTEFEGVVEATRRANAAIYFISGLGLEGLNQMQDAAFSSELPGEDIGAAIAMSFEMQGGSESLASQTGGFTVKNSNDLAAGFERISDESRSYYLIGYNPTNAARDGDYRKIEVKVPGRRGLKIRARKGYYAPTDDPERQRRAGSVFQRALDSPYDQDEVGLRMTHVIREETLMGKARVFLAAEIDVADVEFAEVGDGLGAATLDLLLLATNGDGESFRHDQTMEMKLLPASRERLQQTWLPYVREFELPPGEYQARGSSSVSVSSMISISGSVWKRILVTGYTKFH
jgi:VWFA-related protein